MRSAPRSDNSIVLFVLNVKVMVEARQALTLLYLFKRIYFYINGTFYKFPYIELKYCTYIMMTIGFNCSLHVGRVSLVMQRPRNEFRNTNTDTQYFPFNSEYFPSYFLV